MVFAVVFVLLLGSGAVAYALLGGDSDDDQPGTAEESGGEAGPAEVAPGDLTDVASCENFDLAATETALAEEGLGEVTDLPDLGDEAYLARATVEGGRLLAVYTHFGLLHVSVELDTDLAEIDTEAVAAELENLAVQAGTVYADRQ